jgi:hypothetical protein
MTTTPRGAPELVSAQATPETTVNEQIRRTEAGACHFPIVDKDLTAPPGSCADGANYIIAATATGLWAGKEKQIATAVGANAASGWYYHTPIEGFTAYAQDENARYLYDGSAWGVDTSGGSYTDESARDAIGTALVAGTGAAIVVDDGGDTITIAAGPATLNAQTGTTYTLVLTDAQKAVTLTNASAITLTIPANGSVAFPTGTAIELHQGGAGTVTVTAGGGVTLQSRGSAVALAGQYAIALLRKVASDTWRLTGDIA